MRFLITSFPSLTEEDKNSEVTSTHTVLIFIYYTIRPIDATALIRFPRAWQLHPVRSGQSLVKLQSLIITRLGSDGSSKLRSTYP